MNMATITRLEVSRLACTRGERQLFRGIDLMLGAGDALRVAGANGSGKTSLMRMLCGLSYPAEGEVRWEGRSIRAQREHFGSQLIYLGHAASIKDDLLAWENLVIGTTLAGRAIGRDAACAALERLGLGAAAELPARVLSQGQRKRVALARLQLGADQPLWILDEPFAALDTGAVTQLCGTLDSHLARGGMVIYTTHQPVELHARRELELDLLEYAAC
jgi:heme exporter protein A